MAESLGAKNRRIQPFAGLFADPTPISPPVRLDQPNVIFDVECKQPGRDVQGHAMTREPADVCDRSWPKLSLSRLTRRHTDTLAPSSTENGQRRTG
jgi:hypothetical protein